MAQAYYRRHLPHYQPPHGTYSIVLRLQGSLPRSAVIALQHERERNASYLQSMKDRSCLRETVARREEAIFRKYDQLLDLAGCGPRWLAEPPVAETVGRSIRYWDGRLCETVAYCIMPNHVHCVLSLGGCCSNRDTPFASGQTGHGLTDVLASIKKHSARYANRILGRSGSFWQSESYDHLVRDGEDLSTQLWYLVSNPVKAGLATRWEDWRWTYVKPGFLE